MFLHRIHLDPRCKEVRRDLSDAYEMHSTLCRAFTLPDIKCPQGAFLWRLESELSKEGYPKLMVQSSKQPHWSNINVAGWFAEKPSQPIDLSVKLRIQKNGIFRYRLRANPSTSSKGKRLGILTGAGQRDWLQRKGASGGFSLATIHCSEEKMLLGRVRRGDSIRIFSVLFDGMLSVSDIARFQETLATGIGHGKAMGLGLLSIAPVK